MRLVSKIEYYENNDNGVSLYQTVEYRYDEQNRITEMTITDENGISVSSVLIHPAENNMESITEYGNTIYTLNSDGSIASWSNDGQLLGTCTYFNNYLLKREYSMEFETLTRLTAETCTWENGNITTAVIEQSYFPDSPWGYSMTLNYEYGSIQNKPVSVEFFLIDFSAPRGWYGKSILNLPSKVTIQSEFGSDVVTNYRFETDKKGYPIRLFLRENDKDEKLRTVIEYMN